MQQIRLSHFLLVGLALRLLAAFTSQGYNVPDEHFQVLEPAYGLLSGHWFKTWEWHEGIRSWFLPGLIAAPLWITEKLAAHLPFHPADTSAALIRLVLGLFSLSWIFAARKLSTPFDSDAHPGRVTQIATAFAALSWAMVYFGVRTLSESIGLSFLSLAIVFGLEDGSLLPNSNRRSFFFALFLSLSALVRFQMAFWGVGGFLLYFFIFRLSSETALDATRRKKILWLSIFAVTVAIAVLFQGLLDRLTWGSWFHSPLEYFRFNIVNKGASQWGEAPWHRNVSAIFRTFGPLFAILILWGFGQILFGLRGVKEANSESEKDMRSLAFVLFPLPFIVVHQMIAHKEDRFLIPLFPFYAVAFSVGLSTFIDFLNRLDRKNVARATKLALYSLLLIQFGYVYFKRPWKSTMDAVILTQALGADTQLTGIILCPPPDFAGHFYLRNKIPVYRPEGANACSTSVLKIYLAGPYPFVLVLGQPAEAFSAHEARTQFYAKCTPYPKFGTASLACTRR